MPRITVIIPTQNRRDSLKRAIQKYLEDVLAEEILSGKLKKGESVIADFDSKSQSIFIAKSHKLKSK